MRAYNSADDGEDNLRAARGIVFGTCAGLAMWVAFVWGVFPA